MKQAIYVASVVIGAIVVMTILNGAGYGILYGN